MPTVTRCILRVPKAPRCTTTARFYPLLAKNATPAFRCSRSTAGVCANVAIFPRCWCYRSGRPCDVASRPWIFAGIKEIVYERSDWRPEKLREYFKNDILCILGYLGYGSQGHGQGLSVRDNGLHVILGVRKHGASWRKAQEEGWVCTQPLEVLYVLSVNLTFLSGSWRDCSRSRRP